MRPVRPLLAAAAIGAVLALANPAAAQTLAGSRFGVDRTATPWTLYHFSPSGVRSKLGTMDPRSGRWLPAMGLPAFGTGSPATDVGTLLTSGAINAALYGILPANSGTANLARLQQAVTDGVQKMVLGQGTYHFNGALNVNTAGSFEITGQGQFSGTHLVQDNLTSDLFDFGDGVTFRKGFFLHDLDITSNGTQTAGYVLRINDAYEANVERVSLTYCNLIDTLDAQGTVLEDITGSITCATTGKGITARGTYPAPANHLAGNLFLNRVNVVGLTGGSQPQAGLSIEHFDGIEALDSQFNLTGIGIEFAPPNPGDGTKGANFSHFFGLGLSLDSNSGSGIQVDDTGGYVFSVLLTQTAACTNQNSGVYFAAGANIDGFRLTQPLLCNNGSVGLYAAGTDANVSIQDGVVAGNGRSASGTYPGIFWGVGTHANWTVTGTMIGQSDNLPASQKYAIGVTTSGSGIAFDNLTLSDNNFTGNASGPVDPNWFTNTFAGRAIGNNQGMVVYNSGTATITTAATSVVVTHGLVTTPNIQDITVTPNSGLGSAKTFWVDTVTATTFTIHVDAAPTSVAPLFAWRAEVR